MKRLVILTRLHLVGVFRLQRWNGGGWRREMKATRDGRLEVGGLKGNKSEKRDNQAVHQFLRYSESSCASVSCREFGEDSRGHIGDHWVSEQVVLTMDKHCDFRCWTMKKKTGFCLTFTLCPWSKWLHPVCGMDIPSSHDFPLDGHLEQSMLTRTRASLLYTTASTKVSIMPFSNTNLLHQLHIQLLDNCNAWEQRGEHLANRLNTQ